MAACLLGSENTDWTLEILSCRLTWCRLSLHIQSITITVTNCIPPRHPNLFTQCLNISECIREIPTMVVEQPSIDEENIKYLANNINNSPIQGQIGVKGHNDYLSLSRRSQVYPENLQTYNGYDIVQANLV